MRDANALGVVVGAVVERRGFWSDFFCRDFREVSWEVLTEGWAGCWMVTVIWLLGPVSVGEEAITSIFKRQSVLSCCRYGKSDLPNRLSEPEPTGKRLTGRTRSCSAGTRLDVHYNK